MRPSPSGRVRPRVAIATLAFPIRSAVLLLAPAAPAHAASGWSLASGPSDAPPRDYHELILDTVRNRLLIAGGLPFTVWALPLDQPLEWSQIACAGAPPEVYTGASAIYDPLRDRLVVFGGLCTNGSPCNPSVWTLSLGGTPTWSTLAVAGGPSARSGHSAIYDPVGDRMIVYGGQIGSSILGDVWSLALGSTPAWAPLAPAGTAPDPRSEHVAAYDAAGGRMIVYGGWHPTSDGLYIDALSEVWQLTLDGAPAWSRILPVGPAPTGRLYAGGVIDPATARLIVYAGLGPLGTSVLSDAWALALSGTPQWTLLDAGDPTMQDYAIAAAFDPAGRRMLVSGGYVHPAASRALALDGAPAWTDLPAAEPSAVPARRYSHATMFDALRDRLLVTGGYANGWQSDLWAWSEPGGWQSLATSGTPFPDVGGAASAYDSFRDRWFFLSGGNAQYFGHKLDRLGALALAGTPAWSAPLASGAPPGRSDHSAIYDAVRDRIVVFGGRRRISASDDTGWGYDDTWALSLATMGWSAITPAGTLPPPRGAHQAFYDAARDRMIVFGGNRYAGDYVIEPLDDAWTLSLGGTPAWTPLGPPAPESGEALLDPESDRLVVFAPGGERAWELSLADPTAWTALPAGSVAPGARNGTRLALDRTNRRAFRFGGQMGVAPAASRNDLWGFSLDDATAVALALVSADADPSRVRLEWRAGASVDWSARLERRDAGASAWSALATLTPDGSGRIAYEDRAIVPGARYDYRLIVRESGAESVAGEVTIAVPREPEFALRARPNPAAGVLFADFSLPAAAPATLELLDIGGRRMDSRVVSGAGRHVMALGGERRLAPGLYLIRITQERRALTTRALVIR